ncbi:MAG: tyrosine-type recombinase/integrase [Puniceicoccales bacterium]
MAKPILLKPTKTKNGKWRLNVPASVSPNGKRQRLWFDTKGLADVEALRLKTLSQQWGREAVRIPANLAADAKQAADILKGHDVTLTALAKAYVELQDIRARSCSFKALWREYFDSMTTRTRKGRPLSERYIADAGKMADKLMDSLGGKLVCDLRHELIEKAFESKFKSNASFNIARRTIRPAFTYGIEKGYLSDDPFLKIKPRDTAEGKVEIATPEQVRAAIEACADHRENESLPPHLRVDCRDALPAVLILAFAGVRPMEELGNLSWDDVSLDDAEIHISEKYAKARNARNIPMQDNLVAWLTELKGEGSIRPTSWKRKWQCIRRLAGFADVQDILRHSFATYFHKAHGDINQLREALGHSTGDVVFNAYLSLPTRKKDAIAFWSIRPNASEPHIREVVA